MYPHPESLASGYHNPRTMLSTEHRSEMILPRDNCPDIIKEMVKQQTKYHAI